MARPAAFLNNIPNHGRITINSLDAPDIVILHSILGALSKGYTYISWFDICNTARNEDVSIDHDLLNSALDKYFKIGILRRSDKPPVYWITKQSFIGA